FSSNSGSWTQLDKVAASDSASYDYFGYRVAGLSSDAFVVGAYGDDDQGSLSGSAYVFTASNSGTWVQADKVV
ncbi:unnamed protein product, partial [Heterosigma akashiwo]